MDGHWGIPGQWDVQRATILSLAGESVGGGPRAKVDGRLVRELAKWQFSTYVGRDVDSQVNAKYETGGTLKFPSVAGVHGTWCGGGIWAAGGGNAWQ